MANPYNPSGPTDNPRTVLLLDRAGNSADTYQRLLQPEAGRYQILAQPYDGPVLDLCRSQSVDHILVESHFPDTRGFELIQRLKTQLGDQCPPIIVVDENDADLAMRAVKAGAADYLVRGQITAERLEQALGQAMEVAMPTLGSASHPAAYRRQQERERFLAVGSDLQAITSRDGRFQWVSPSFERLLGWTAAEMVSHAWSEFVHTEDVSPSTAEAEHLFSGTETLAFENRFRHKDGSYRWLLWRLQLDLEQQVSYGTAIDISVLKQFESALHASRDELVQRSHIFEAMLSTISDFVYLFDREGRFVFVNQPLLDLWGLTLADAVGKNFFDLNYPNALAAKQQQEIERVFTTGQSVRDEASYTSPTGKGGVYEYIFTPLLGPDGSVQSVVGSTRDVTERKQSEAMLRESEERFRLMADTVPQIIWITDAQGRVKFVNQQWRAYTGASYESATAAEALVSFVHPQDVALTMKGFSQALQVGGSFRAEHRIRSAEGTYRWFLIQAEPYRDPTTGAIERWFGTLVDIHDRKFAEAALGESEAKYRSLFNSMNEGFCILQVIVEGDRQPIDYRYVEVNPAFEQHTGLSNVLGKTIRELVPDIEPAWFDFYSSVALTGEPARFEYQVEALERWFDSSAFRIGDPHERRIAVLFSDITKRKQTQIQLHHAAAMDAFQVALSDALRMLSDPIEVQAAACRLLGEKLNTSRVYYYEYNQDTLSGVVHHDYRQSGENSIAGVYNFEDFVSVHTLLHTGQPLVLTDVANSTVLTEGERFRFKALNFGALVSIPLVKDRRLVAVFSVVQSSPRQWTSLELSLIQTTAERTWTDVERARVEAALRESEAKYRTLFTSIDEGYFLVDVIFDDDNQPVDVLYLDANPSATRMVGHDFTGQRLSEIDPNYEFYWYDIFGRVASTGVSQRLERYAEPDKKWYDFYAFKVGEQDNHRVAVVFQDITERKRREANAAFVAAITEDFSRLSSADEIMQAVGAKVGAYLNVSSCLFAEINEAQDQTIVEYSWHTADIPDMAGVYRLSEFVTEEFRQAAHRQKPVVICDTQTDPRTHSASYAAFNIQAFVTVPFHREGEWKYLFTVNDSAARDWSDNDIELIHEITTRIFPRIERARAEAAVAADLNDTQLLRELSVRLTSEDNIQVLYDEVLAAAIALTRADAGIIQILDEATQELVLLTAQGVDLTLAEEYYRVDAESTTPCGTTLTSGTRCVVDFDHPEGDDLECSLPLPLKAGYRSGQSTPLMSRAGKPMGMVSTHWRNHHRPTQRELRFLDLLARQAADLIEQRRAVAERERILEREQAARQDAERANRIKDEFLAILSHELRSPLNPILGWSRLLQTRTFDAAKTNQALATIERNAKLQTQLIDDLLDVAKILRGKLELSDTPVNLALVIDAAREVVKTSFEAKSIALQTALAEDCLVRGDGARLQQIIWNLLSNAIKFTPPGGQVDVCLQPVDDYAQITIADTGKGISAEFLPQLFESFRQEDVSITRQYGGLGLGLSIVKYLVEAHGGSIVADSRGEGQGSTFTIQLPLLRSAPSDPLDDVAFSAELSLVGVKVLTVDDSPDSLELLATLLSQYGAEVKMVTSGHEVLAHLASFEPNVLMCDIAMPDMDGYTLLQHIRSLPPEAGGQVPAIAVTAYASEDDHQRALNQGFQKHITKPIDTEKLLSTVAELAQRHQ